MLPDIAKQRRPDLSPLISADDLYKMPDHGGRNELVEGELIPMSPTSIKHGLVTMNISGHLWNYVRIHKLGEIFAAETGFILGRNPDTVRAPDVAFITRERMPAVPIPETGFAEIVPDLVVEVISPNDRRRELDQKIREYLKAGVRLIWVADPHTETVAEYRPRSKVQQFNMNDELNAGDVLPGFTLPVNKIFDY